MEKVARSYGGCRVAFIRVPDTDGAVVGAKDDPVPVWSIDEGGDAAPSAIPASHKRIDLVRIRKKNAV